jgi:hypothetical protein
LISLLSCGDGIFELSSCFPQSTASLFGIQLFQTMNGSHPQATLIALEIFKEERKGFGIPCFGEQFQELTAEARVSLMGKLINQLPNILMCMGKRKYNPSSCGRT